MSGNVSDKVTDLLTSVLSRLRSNEKTIVAVDGNGERYVSSKSFLEMVDRFVFLLKKKGVKDGDFTIVRLERKAEHIAAFIACMCIGSPFVTVHPKYPADRAEKIFAICEPVAVIDDGFVSEAEALGTVPKVVAEKISDECPLDVFFTSGSTGEPKGVMHSRNRFLRAEQMVHAYRDSMGDSAMCIVDLSFVLSEVDWAFSILSGCTMHIADDNLRKDVVGLKKYVADHGVYRIATSPSFLRIIGSDISVKTVFIAGEKPGVFEGFDDVDIINIYGATECTVIASHKMETDGEITIGNPLLGDELFLVDENGDHAEKGEICLKCRRNMMRYMHLPDCGGVYTDCEDGYSIYHTGDLGKMTSEGIVVIGRMDGMAKINGQRVESSEVEYCMSNIDGVKDAVVKVFDGNGTQYLCAYYTSDSVGEDTIRSEIGRKLPPYMVPAFVIRLEKMPLNANGKADRHSLPKPDISSLRSAYVEPRNDNERKLCKAFAEALGLEKAGIDDDFIQLGGDSLKAMRLVMICRSLGVKIKANSIITKRTVRALLSDASDGEDMGSYFGPIALSPVQELFMSEGTPENRDASVLFVLLECKESVDTALIQKAIDCVTDHHDMLRAVYSDKSYVREPGISVCTVSERKYATEEEAIKRLSVLWKISSISEERLIIVSHAWVGKKEYILLAIHRMIVDRKSWYIILDDFVTAYDSLKSGNKPYLPPRTASYQKWLKTNDETISKEDRKYWEKAFEDIQQDDHGPSSSFHKYFGVRASVLADIYGMDPADIMLTAFVQAYSKVTGRKNISLRIEDDGHHLANADRTVGWFAGFYPITVSISGRFEDDIRSIRKAIRNAHGGGACYCSINRGHLKERLPDISFSYTSVNFEYKKSIFECVDYSITGLLYSGPVLGEATSINIVETKEDTVLLGNNAYPGLLEEFNVAMEDFVNRFSSIETNGHLMSESELNAYLDEVVRSREDELKRASVSDVILMKNNESYSGPIGLSPVQDMFMSMGTPEQRNWFNNSLLLECDEKIDVAIMQEAVDTVTAYHDTLRAVYSDRNYIREPEVRICEVQNVDIDTSGNVRAYIDEMQQSLSLSDGRLMACSVITYGGHQYIFLTIHHMIVDNLSCRILLDDLTESYCSLISGMKPELPDRTMAYHKWLEAHSVIDKEEEKYWRAVSREIHNVAGGSSEPFRLRSSVKISDFDDNVYGLKAMDILITAFAEAYRDVTGKDTVSVRIDGSGRSTDDVGRTVGWMTEPYPLRVKVTGTLSYDMRSVMKALSEVPKGGSGFGVVNRGRMKERLPDIILSYAKEPFSYNNGPFHSVPDVPIWTTAGLSVGCSTSLDVTDLDVGSVVSGTSVYPGLPMAFMRRLSQISLNLESAMGDECPFSDSQLNFYLDFITDPNTYSLDVVFHKECPKSQCSLESLKDALAKVLLSVHCLNVKIEDRDAPYMLYTGGGATIEKIADIGEFLKTRLDVRGGRMYIAGILETEDSYTAIVKISHIVIDGTSVGLLQKKLDAAIAGSALETDTIMFRCADVSADDLKEGEKFYASMFSGCEVTKIERDMHSSGGSASMHESVYVTVPMGVTPNALITSAVAYAISKFTGNDYSTLSIVDSGRQKPEYGDAVGLFIRILPLCIKNIDNAKEYMESVQNLVIESMEHNYPFRMLAKEYGVSSDMVTVDFLSHGLGIEEGTINMETGRVDTISDITLYVTKTDFGYDINADYDSGKYSEHLMKSFLKSISMIAEGLASGVKLSKIDYVPEESKQMLERFNSLSTIPLFDDVVGMFVQCAESFPDNVAISFNDRKITYSELDSITDSIAFHLADMGIGSGDAVATCVPKSEWSVILPMAVVKAGAAYVPIDITYPEERIQDMMAGSKVSVMLTIKSCFGQLSVFKPVYVDELEHREGKFRMNYSDDDPFVLLYTSGTTGKPKGIVVTRGNVACASDWYRRNTDISELNVSAFYVSPGYAPHYDSVFAPLTCGASVAVVPEDIRMDMAKLDSFFRSENVTHAIIPSPVYRAYSSAVEKTNVKYFFTPGEMLGSVKDIGAEVFCDYGQSESPNMVISRISERISDADLGPHTDSTKIYILDSEGRQVPVGAVGEICAAGPMVAVGYVKSLGGFTINTFSADAGYSRLRHTGDVGRYSVDGHIELFGRKDGMVKIRGNRVELTEIANVLKSANGVKDAIVRAVNADGTKLLCAYVLSDSPIDTSYLRNFVSERKPQFMIPSFIIQIDDVPLNVNGKVDEHALPKPDFSTLRSEYVAPRNESERRICEAFSEALRIDRIGIDDDFIHLGGDSLRAIKVQNIIHTVQVADILRLRTPRSIAELSPESKASVQSYTLSTGCPLSESQLNIYLDIELHGNEGTYLLRGMIDTRHMKQGGTESLISKLVEAHPVLKGRIVDNNGVPWLYCDSYPKVTHGEPEKLDMTKEVCSFGIGNGSISLYLSHVVFDGSSIAILKNTVKRIMADEAVSVDTGFLIPPSYDASVKGTDRYAKAKEFFGSMLCDCDTDSGLVPEVTEGSNGIIRKKLRIRPDDVAGASRKIGVTSGAYYAAAFAYTLSRFTGRSDAVFCLIENGRNIPGLEDKVGMFVKTLPVRMECSDRPVAEYVNDASAVYLGAMSNDIYPFRLLAKEYGVKSNVLFQHAVGVDIVDNELETDISESLTEDISIKVGDKDAGVYIEVIYSGRYVGIAKRFADVFDSVVEGMISCENLSDIRYTSEADIASAEKINATEKKLRYRNVLEAFRENVEKHPDSTFVAYLDRSYTYEQADEKTDGIASALAKEGIGNGDRVAILVQRSEWYILCALGVLKTGAAYVPIDESHPDERIRFIISDSSSKIVLVTDETEKRAESFGVPVMKISPSMCGKFSVRTICQDDTAMILYTSGTTGQPKGAALTHLNVENYSEWYCGYTGMGNTDRFMMYCSFGFDVHIEVFYASIQACAAVDVLPEERRFDIDSMADFIVSRKVTHVHLPAAVGKIFIVKYPALPINVMCVGGEKFGELSVLPKYKLYDKYGPTEATVSATATVMAEKCDSSSLGRPLQNTKLYVLDREKRRVPYGAVGELYISGYQLSSGYINRPDMDKKAFFDNPFCNEEGYERMYATGDFFRYLSNGTLGIIGRRDGQIKVRGNRVELTEVEACIRQMSGVKDVTVQAIMNETGVKELCAYIVSNTQIDQQSLQSFVSERKPQYMVPSYVMQLEKIPLNVNGKVDKRALPTPDASSMRKAYVEPRTESERRLCEAFSEVLGIEKIGIDDDFIQLGGDSLKAIRVQNTSKTSSTADILKYRTPRDICLHIQCEDIDLNRYRLDTGCPLSESQLNVYLDIIANEKKGTYVIPFEYIISKKLSLKKTKEIVDRVIDSHPILKARVSEKDGVPWLFCDSYPEFTEKLSVDSLDVKKCVSVFSLSEGRVSVMISHMAFDGFSIGTLKRALDDAFNGRECAEDTGFLLSSSFDASVKETERYGKAREFYDAMFCDADTDSSFIADIDGKAGCFKEDLSVSKDAIVSKSKSLGISSGALLTSVFAYTLSRFTGRSDSVFTIAENGRELPGLENAVGMFVRTLPVRIDCCDSEISEYIKKSADAVYGTMSSGVYPFRLLAKEYGIRSDIIFQYMAGIEATVNTSSLMEDNTEPTAFISDMLFAVMDLSDRFTVSVTHSSKYSDATAKRFAEAYGRILKGFLRCERLSEIQYVSDKDVVLEEEINATEKRLCFNNILEAFRADVKEHSEDALVTFLDRTYTYGHSDCITDGIAAALVKTGIRKGDNVAILVPRSEWYLLCALGVLKTGAAYVPIDDSHPDERIQFMIADSSAKAVLVTEETEKRAELFGAPILKVTASMNGKFSAPAIHPNDAAVILYTSGTTGKPKGSLITHFAVINLSEWYCANTEMTETDKMALHTAYAFDMHTMAMFPPIVCGSSLTVIPEDVRMDMDALDEFIAEKKIAHLFMTTQLGKVFASRLGKTPLKVLYVAGEKLGTFEQPAGIRMYDGYGPSENLALSTSVLVNERTDPSDVGRPNTNVKAYILDRERRRVPYGAVGELYLSGYQLSLGYLNRPDANEKAFFDNPFSAEEGHERMYATGDFFRYLPGGTLGVIGRRDGQVKIRGNRVELTEVESAIRQMPGTKDVTVQAVVNESGGKELCAYIVSDDQIEPEDVRSFVSERKPQYMVPSYVMQLEKIPLNVNGKVDRRALPKPDTSSMKKEYAEPRTEDERKLCEAFAEVLGIEKIGIDDDFIQMGGDSLKAIRLASLCRSSGITVNVNDVITKRTVRSISPSISAAEDMGSYSGTIGFSPLQEMFMSSGTPENRDRFNQSMLLECKNAIDSEILQKAIDCITDRHDMLRAVYSDRCYIREPGISVCTVSENKFRSKKAATEHTGVLQESLSLSEGKLIACSLFSVGRKQYLFITIHHMVVDGVSWSVLLDDLTSAYVSIKSEEEPSLPPRTLPYQKWLESYIEPDTAEKEYWEKASENISHSDGTPVPFCITAPQPVDTMYGADTVDILLTAFAEAYRNVTGKDTISVRMEGHGRQSGNVDRTVGWFTAAYPLTLTVCGEIARDVRSVRKALHSVPNGGIGYGMINRGNLMKKLPDMTFNYLSTAFSYSNDLFISSSGIPIGRISSEAPMGDTTSFNITDTGTELMVSGYTTYPELPKAFVSKLEEMRSGLETALGSECPLTEDQLNLYLDFADDPDSPVLDVTLYKKYPKKKVKRDELAVAVSRVLSSVKCFNAKIEDRDIPCMVAVPGPEVEQIDDIDAFLERRLDVRGGRMYAAGVYEDTGNVVAVVKISHLVVDRTSVGVIQRKIDGALKGESSDADNAMFMCPDDSADAMRKSAEFYSQMFSGYDTVRLEPDAHRETEAAVAVKDVAIPQIPDGITPNALITSAVAYTLSKFVHEEYSTLSIVDSGRQKSEFKDAVGLFIRILPLCIQNSTDGRGYMENVQKLIVESMEHNYPFRMLAKEYGVGSDMLTVDFLDRGLGAELDDDYKSKGRRADTMSDVTLYVIRSDRGFRMLADYDSGKYSEHLMNTFLESVAMVAGGLASGRNLPEIDYLPKESVSLLEKFNSDSVAPEFRDVVDMFSEYAEAHPGDTALSFLEKKYTYSELDRLTDSIASNLMEMKVGENCAVAVCVPKSEWSVILPMAVLKTGAAYVPVDITHPKERMEEIVSDSHAVCMLTIESCMKQLSGLDPVPADSMKNNVTKPKAGYAKDDAFVILYTSGTTGKPKGITVTRDNVACASDWYRRNTNLMRGSVSAYYVSPGYAPHYDSVFAPLTCGASVSVIPEDIRMDMEKLDSFFKAEKVTHAIIPSPVFRVYSSAVKKTNVKYFFTPGEMLGKVNDIGTEVFCDYGQSESPNMILSRISERRSNIDLGPHTDCTKIYLLDSEGRQVPVGAVGELCAAGPMVAAGYTVGGGFPQNPFCSEAGYDRLRHTGDVGRYSAEGRIELFGRKDGMVKIRGNRVELTEVADVLKSAPGVKDVVIRAVDADGTKHLCAYIMSDIQIDPPALQSFVSERKPQFMVPSFVMQIEKIPLNMNGKVDARALPKPDLSSLRREYAEPRTEDERKLCDAFSEVLGAERIGIDDDFIQLGGDSLKAMKVRSIVRTVSVADILGLRTPRAIAGTASASAKYDVGMYTLETGCPLSESQLNVYLDIQVNGNEGTYLLTGAINTHGMKQDDVKELISRLTEAHPILKGRIAEKDGVPWLFCDSYPKITEGEPEMLDLRKDVCSFGICRDRTVFHLSHVVFDGTSASVLNRTVGKIVSGEDVAVDTGFLTAASYDESVKGTEGYEKAKEFFARMLCDCDTDSGLVPDVISGSNGVKKKKFKIKPKDVADASRKMGVTSGAYYAAAFAYTLSRFTGRSDAVFCLIENGRNFSGLEDAVGMFVKTLPVHVTCSDRTIAEYVKEVSDVYLGAIGNDAYPFRLLANEYGVKANVLFQYAVGVDEGSDGAESDMSGDLTEDISVKIRDKDSGVSAEITYSGKYAGIADRFIEAFAKVLKGMMSYEKLSEIQYTSEEDIILADKVNNNDKKLRFNDILEAFRESVKKHPDNVLVAYLDKSYTYREADGITDGIASALAEMGAGRGDAVAVLVPRSEWYLLCALGVLKTGAAYVPIDNSYPDESVQHIIADSSAKAVLATEETEERAGCFGAPVLTVSGSMRGKPPKVHIDPRDRGVVLFTSGTTGKPKGNQITRRAMENFIEWYVDSMGFVSSDVMAMYTAYVFDMHITAMYPEILTGSRVEIIPDDIRMDLSALNEMFISRNVTHVFITTQLGRMFAMMDDPHIRVLVVAGEKLGEFTPPKGFEMYDAFGPSESLVSTYVKVKDRCDASCIGIPTPNVKLHILDAEKRKVPYGAVGELFITGHQLSLGYLNRPELNEKMFSTNPFSSEEGYERMYASGDFVRYLPDGTLGIIGRRDGQVKIRGNRVELTEVEVTIREIPEIKDVTVQVIVNESGGKELCAYIVSDSKMDPQAVQSFVSERKPQYMVPSFVIQLDRIPLNVNGKVDRRVLPKPDTSALREKYVAPRNEKEKALCDAFAEVLEVEKVGIDDDFIQLGGDSLKAIHLVSICSTSGITIQVSDVISMRTVRAISPMIAGAEDYDTFSGAIGLSPLQEMFMEMGTAEQRNGFNQFMLLECKRNVNATVMQKAIDAITDRHDMLRAVYSNEPYVREPGTSVCTVEEITFASEEDAEEYMDALRTSMSLTDGKLTACSLIHVNGKQYLFLAIHYMVADAVSWNIILEDLTATYSSLESGKEIALPSRTVPYQKWLEIDAIEDKEKEYWRKAQKEVHSISCAESSQFTFCLDTAISELTSNDYGVSARDVLLTAFIQTLSEFIGGDSISVRMDGSGRHIGNVGRTVGWFADVYPLTVENISGDAGSVLQSIKDSLNAVPRDGVGYGTLNRGHLCDRLPDVAFGYHVQRFDNELFSVAYSESISRFGTYVDSGVTLSVNVTETEGGSVISGSSPYPEFLERFIGRISKTVSEINESLGMECPLSENQMSFYLDFIDDPSSPSLNMVVSREYPKKTHEKERLRAAVSAVFASVHGLNVRIESRDRPYMVYLGGNVDVEDISKQEEITNRRLDVNTGPMYKVGIYETENSFIVMAVVSHLVIDGMSVGTLLDRIEAVYNGSNIGYDRTLFVRSECTADVLKGGAEFYESMFSGVEVVKLEPDMHGKNGSVFIHERVRIPECPVGITPNALMTSAAAYAMSKFTDKDYSTINIVDSGRQNPEYRNAVGLFARILPFCIRNTDNGREYMENVQEMILQSMQHNYPYRLLSERYNVGLDMLTVDFLDHGFGMESGEMRTSGERNDTISDITVYVIKTDTIYDLLIEYNPGKYSDGLMKKLLKFISATAKSLASGANLSKIDIIDKNDE